MKGKNFPRSAKGRPETMCGTLCATARGYAFITPDGGGGDFFVPKKSVNGAFHGDRVLFLRVRGAQDEAEVIKIVSRNPSPVVGTTVTDKRGATVFPDDRRRPAVYVPRGLLGGAGNGDKVVCKITRYFKGRPPVGMIDEVLGEEGDTLAEELSIIRAYGLREDFPEEAVLEARAASMEKPVPDGRRDLRDKTVFTIDGTDTRDVDDAVSVWRDVGNYVLGVHIADVCRYVGFGSATDGEAYLRGTSVYFPDRVLPMLPKELSNGICSLNEGEDRYAISVFINLDKDGNRLSYEICESIIRSRHKMSYPEVAAICGKDENLRKKYSDISGDIDVMEELCLALEKKREASGSVALDLKEARINVGADGKITVSAAKRTIAERIIEQFMIAANEAVADFMSKRGLPCLYRIHEPPSPEKTREFSAFLKYAGIAFPGKAGTPVPGDFKKILKEAEGKPVYPIVNKVMLRSMQKARYCAENKGHFALASDCYCHFTSPIRRYPDLFVHRSLKEALHGKIGRAEKLFAPLAQNAADDASARERAAEDAERDVDDLYKLVYMSDRIGETFEATVSGVTPDSVYCELDNAIEGVIPREDLPPDDYEFFGEKYLYKGRKHKFAPGDRIKVEAVSCDLGRMKTIMRICV